MIHKELPVSQKGAILLICSLAAAIGFGELVLSTDMSDAQAGGRKTPIRLTSTQNKADIKFSSPKWHAVIFDRRNNIKRLYSRGSLIFQDDSWTPVLTIERIDPHGVLFRETKTDRKKLLSFGHPLPGLPHLTLMERVALTDIHYSFKVVNEQPDQEPIIKLIKGSRAYLVKEVLNESLLPAPQPLLQTSGSGASQGPLPGDLISNIRVTQMEEDIYEVDKESLKPLAKSVRRGLGNLKESFGLAFSVISPSRLELKSSVGEATLSDQGFTITRFGNYRKEELGLKVGDRILSINDRSVTSPLSAWGVVRILLAKNQELNQLRVNLVRDDIPITKTYRLK